MGYNILMVTYCIECGKPLLFLPIFNEGREAMFCNNPDCHRFGLLTAVSTPEGIDEEEHKEGSDKEIQS